MRGLSSIFVVSIILASAAAAQPGDLAMHRGHHGAGPRLFLAKADGSQVVPAKTTAASATAAIIVSADRTAIDYDLTYRGLEVSPPRRIALRNFGIGGRGKEVFVICGEGANPCPDRAGARLAGKLAPVDLPPRLLSEFASGRMYLEIDTKAGPEIRGQLDANNAMVKSRTYIAKLGPGGSPGSSGEGTGVISESYLPGDRVAVDYSITVTGTSGFPQELALKGIAANADPGRVRFSAATRFMGSNKATFQNSEGATFNGSYIAQRSSAKAVFATKFWTEGTRVPALSVKTSRFPKGELSGVFVPVE